MCKFSPRRLFVLSIVLCWILFPYASRPAFSEEEDAAQPHPAPGYVLLRLTDGAYWLPLPEEGEYSLPIRQTATDGTEIVNVIHLTPDGVNMESSTCENQDCVQQGSVTLENRHERLLGGWIICLPNQVSLELYTPEEVLELYATQEVSEEAK
ncbi:MAG: NusG domain II-containing protein [Clostridia bacterium]|nr:NusG domain II-containing protein [Clostridia bacterium]